MRIHLAFRFMPSRLQAGGSADAFASARDLTPRLIRQGIEKELALDEGVLDASEYKSAIKAATKYALVRALLRRNY